MLGHSCIFSALYPRTYTKKVLLLLYLRRGSRIARIVNTAKVVHQTCTNISQLNTIPMKLARFLRIKLVLLE